MSRSNPQDALAQSQLRDEMKAEAISLLHAWKGIEYPSHYTFDVLIGAAPNPDNNGRKGRQTSKGLQYITRAIVYTDRAFRDWQIVCTGEGVWHTPTRSLEEFVDQLRCSFGMMTEDMAAYDYDNARVLIGKPKVDENGDEVEEKGADRVEKGADAGGQ